jgi:DNA-binding response OmpR family regulator
MKVLLVDDEIELVSTLAERLSFRGIDAQWASSGADALAKAEQQFFDIAILDLKMPKIGGLALKEKLWKKYPKMKFIFCTGYGSEEDFGVISKQLGEEFYLVKPLDIEILIEKINAVLGLNIKE